MLDRTCLRKQNIRDNEVKKGEKMMLGKSWILALRDGSHTVEVKHKPWFGIGVVRADGKLVNVFPAKVLSLGLSSQPEQHFEVCGVPCLLKVKPGIFTYDYELYVNGKPVSPE